jgi:hypothetical protein
MQVDSTAAATSHHSPCTRENKREREVQQEHVRLNIRQLTTEQEVEVQHNHGQKQHVQIHMLCASVELKNSSALDNKFSDQSMYRFKRTQKVMFICSAHAMLHQLIG